MAEDAARELPIFGSRMRSGGWGGHRVRQRGELDHDLPRLALVRRAHDRARVSKEREGRLVSAGDDRREALDTLAQSELLQLSEELPADPVAVTLVDHLERHLGRVRIGLTPYEAGDADDPPRDLVHRRDGLPAAAPHIDEAVELGLWQARLRTVEAEAAGALGHALEDGEDRLPVLTGKSPERN